MRSLWSDRDAEAIVARYAESGVATDLALRVYTSRLLGGDPRLVLHGGGNTSVKTVMPDLLGEPAEVLCVKGSGWDMADIEPAGLPAVRLAPLRRLRGRDALSDEDMVRIQRANLLDPGAPNPSVETLLHAFLPHKFIDHTHATAVLSLADQPDAAERVADLYGPRVGLVPYIMPGFLLAKKAAEVYEADPAVEGLVLLKHGVFSFGDSAREAYERMIAIVTLGRGAASRAAARSFSPPARLPARHGGCGRGRADPARRLCAARSGGRGPLQALRARFPRRPGGAEFRQRRRAGALRAGRGRHPRPHDPHQELPAASCRRPKPAGSTALPPRRATPSRGSSPITTPISRATTPPSAIKRKELDPVPRVILVPGLGLVRSRAQRQGRRDRRRSRRKLGRDRDRRRSDRPVRVAVRGRIVRDGILVARTGQARRRGRKAARGPDRAGHRRGRHDRLRDGACAESEPGPRSR